MAPELAARRHDETPGRLNSHVTFLSHGSSLFPVPGTHTAVDARHHRFWDRVHFHFPPLLPLPEMIARWEVMRAGGGSVLLPPALCGGSLLPPLPRWAGSLHGRVSALASPD